MGSTIRARGQQLRHLRVAGSLAARRTHERDSAYRAARCWRKSAHARASGLPAPPLTLLVRGPVLRLVLLAAVLHHAGAAGLVARARRGHSRFAGFTWARVPAHGRAAHLQSVYVTVAESAASKEAAAAAQTERGSVGCCEAAAASHRPRAAHLQAEHFFIGPSDLRRPWRTNQRSAPARATAAFLAHCITTELPQTAARGSRRRRASGGGVPACALRCDAHPQPGSSQRDGYHHWASRGSPLRAAVSAGVLALGGIAGRRTARGCAGCSEVVHECAAERDGACARRAATDGVTDGWL